MIKSDYSDLIKFNHYETGSNGAVIVLHGGPGAPGSAEGLAKALSTDFSVYEPLQRVSGGIPLNVDTHINDLADLNLPASILIGHSWGAMLGLSYTCRFPDRVSNLILIGCGTYSQNTRKIYKDRLDGMIDKNTSLKINALRKKLKDQNDRILRELAEIYMEIECYSSIGSFNSENLIIDSKGHSETWNDVLRLQRQGIEPDRFKNIKCPVLMIHGNYDPHPGKDIYLELREFIKHIEYKEIMKCGHEPWREKYGRGPLLLYIRNFIKF